MPPALLASAQCWCSRSVVMWWRRFWAPGSWAVGFGGAGPAHAAGVARILGVREVIVPPASGAASCLGFLAAPLSFDKVLVKLALHDPVKPAHFLLLAQLKSELRRSSRTALSVLPGRIVAPFDGAFVRVTALSFQKELEVLSPAKTTHRFGVSSQTFLLSVIKLVFVSEGGSRCEESWSHP